MGTISVKNLRLKTIIGFNPSERIEKQEVLINYRIEFDSTTAEKTDNVEDTIDYKKINKQIIAIVENSSYNLLEALTRNILESITKNPATQYAMVEVDKPGALRFTDSVSFSLTFSRQTQNTVCVSFGSNIDPEKNIQKVKEILTGNFLDVHFSDFEKTKPLGYTQQDDFLNGAVFFKTALTPIELKKELLKIESQMGRVRDTSNKNGPRPIDLDITVFNNLILDEDFYHKPFVKKAILQLLPQLSY